MRNRIVFLILKVTILLGVFLFCYYLLLSRFNGAQEKLISAKTQIQKNRSNLVQNRISYIELTRLDPNSGNFDFEKSDLITQIKKTNKDGLDDSTFPDEAKEIYKKQNMLLEKVFATNSYAGGVAILKSQESLEMLKDQTNLIMEWEFQLQERQKELELAQTQSGLKKWLQVPGQYR
ncbi:MAG: hypothetical protein US53_C0015G0004 [Candidatus Woesebacteria bacterium GW2011_GWA1_37_7]|uniref:Uncharacterized protein n=1 Tax=Candidatus Woesebacteria bacterium GW2011_GWA1_37_7 TaxID=1618545 RepID=A0A0G0H616_9BACT|nr:MAG: hypothetical protein US53_C0015G0004 [Candidatus Woesebacteria bacterium GW2011_GWA1_37_7]